MEDLHKRRIRTSEFIDMSLLITRITDAIERFSKGGWVNGEEHPSRWRELASVLSASSARYQSAQVGDIEINAGTLAGRVMATFQRGDAQLTVIGEDGRPEKGCTLQSIEASADETVDILDSLIVGWGSAVFHPNPNAAIV